MKYFVLLGTVLIEIVNLNLFKMKKNAIIKRGYALLVIFFFALTINQVNAQDKKVEKAESKFCTSVVNFIQSLEALDKANQGSDMDAFNKAYKKADKDWNKLVKNAYKLENVEIKEGVKAYNNIVDEINKIGDGTKSGENTDKIAKHITKSASTINQIIGPICD